MENIRKPEEVVEYEDLFYDNLTKLSEIVDAIEDETELKKNLVDIGDQLFEVRYIFMYARYIDERNHAVPECIRDLIQFIWYKGRNKAVHDFLDDEYPL